MLIAILEKAAAAVATDSRIPAQASVSVEPSILIFDQPRNDYQKLFIGKEEFRETRPFPRMCSHAFLGSSTAFMHGTVVLIAASSLYRPIHGFDSSIRSS